MSPEEKQRRDDRILEVYRECGSIRETRRRLGHSIKTIRKVIHGQNAPKQRLIARPARRPSKLDPYKAVVKRLVLEDQLTAILVLEEVRALGYDGGYSAVKRYVRRLRPRPKKGPTTVVEHPPGDEGQVDWSPYTLTIGGEKVDVHAFSMVLPFSSWMFLRFALDERLPTLVGLHDEGFERLDAVPHRMSPDNRNGKFFVSFLPAVSTKAAKAARNTIREWRMASTRNNQSLEDLAQLMNPVVRGWTNYYGRFYRSKWKQVLRHLDRALVAWVCWKFRRFRRRERAATHWLGSIARRDPDLFAHWQLGVLPAAGAGGAG